MPVVTLTVRAGICRAAATAGIGPLLPFPTVLSLLLACRRIGKDLSNTFAKLEKLTICECSRGVSEVEQWTKEGGGAVLPDPCLQRHPP